VSVFNSNPGTVLVADINACSALRSLRSCSRSHHDPFLLVSQVPAAILDPPNFYPEKLTVSYINDSSSSGPAPALPRRYTLTHNDMTGALKLTIGREYNTEQIAGFYTRLLRDEITAEWVQSSTGPSLHVHCHVSGEEKWLAPPILRNFIFRREMNLVSGTAGPTKCCCTHTSSTAAA
jgi:hypothetical protein